MGYDSYYTKRLLYHNFVKYQGDLWLWDIFYNSLFCCRKGNAIAVKIDLDLEREGLDPFMGALYSKVLLFQGKLVCVPQMADKVLIYDLENRQECYVEISGIEWDEVVLRKGKFWDGVVVGKYAYFIGYYSPYLLKFDMERGRVEHCIDLYQGMTMKKDRKEAVYFKFGKLKNNMLYIPACLHPVVFMMDLDTMKVIKKEIKGMKKGFSSLCMDGNDIWLTPRNSEPIICWKEKEDEISIYNEFPAGFKNSSLGFSIKLGDSILFLPLMANKVLLWNKQYGKMEIEKAINSYFEKFALDREVKGQKYCLAEMYENRAYIFMGINRELIVYDLEEGIIERHVFVISDEDYKNHCIQKFKWCRKMAYTVTENAYAMFKDFVSFVVENRECGESIEHIFVCKDDVGRAIYEGIKE